MDLLYGVPAARIAALTGVSVVTARRWKRTRALPAAVRRLLAILISGELGELDRAWRHWRLEAGMLCGPDGFRFTPGEVLAIPFVIAQVRALQRRERVALQADFIEGRYVEPEELDAIEA